LDGRTASGKDGTVTWQHGMLPFFGGRSTTWSAWCPRPTKEEMDGWPQHIIDKLHSGECTLFKDAEKLLNVQRTDMVDGAYTKEEIFQITKTCKRPVYRALQKSMQNQLEDALKNGKFEGTGIYRTDPAPIASKSDTGTDFQKFSTTGPLLHLLQKYENLHIVTNCTVKKIISQDSSATALDTSRGICPIGNAKVILAMGTLPPTTLIRNSFPHLPNIGERFSSHFITSVVARVPKDIMKKSNHFGALEVGAMYVAGVADGNYKNQFHIQLSAIYDEDPEENYARAMRYMPDVVATASPEQLRTSKDHVIFVCAVLGELDYDNDKNKFLKNSSDPEVTTNSILRVMSDGKEDMKTWDAMDEATFSTIENIASCNKDQIEYWQNGQGWTRDRPSIKNRRVDALVHESSTLHFGDKSDKNAPVDASDYKLKGVENVYVTGAGLWPQGGSWNPTMTMVALSLDLADKVITLNTSVPGLDLDGIISSIDDADNVYLCIKDRESRYLWVNEKFANLVGEKADNLIGKRDTHEEHVKGDQEVLKTGKPLLNMNETIDVPSGSGTCMKTINIVTQKGLVRNKLNPNEIIGISVCFSIKDEKK